MLGPLIASLLSGEASRAAGRVKRTIVLYVLAGVFFLCGAGFALWGGYIAAARRIGEVEAALAFAGGFVLLALILILYQRLAARAEKRREAELRVNELKAVAVAAAIGALPALLSGRGLKLLAAPAIAAIAYAIYRENTEPKRRRPRTGAEPD